VSELKDLVLKNRKRRTEKMMKPQESINAFNYYSLAVYKKHIRS